MKLMKRTLILVVSVIATIVVSVGAQVGDPTGWPQWRGAQRDGVASLTVPATWPAALSKRWEVAVGLGNSSPIVAGDRVVMHPRDDDQEVVRALELKTGKELWRSQYAAPYTMNPAARGHGPGPKSTPVASGGRVFAFGISGILSALDVPTGKLLWRVDAPPAPPEFGTAM